MSSVVPQTVHRDIICDPRCVLDQARLILLGLHAKLSWVLFTSSDHLYLPFVPCTISDHQMRFMLICPWPQPLTMCWCVCCQCSMISQRKVIVNKSATHLSENIVLVPMLDLVSGHAWPQLGHDACLSLVLCTGSDNILLPICLLLVKPDLPSTGTGSHLVHMSFCLLLLQA